MTFNQKVINKKNETVKTLKSNNEVVDELKENIRVLNTNEALVDTDRLEGTEPLSVVLDALPAQPNSSALGASLQQKLLDVGGVSIESLTVEPIYGVEDDEEAEDVAANEMGEINFEFSVSADKSNISALKKVLLNLEQSIRTIDVQSLNIEQQNNTITLSVEGKAFYKSEFKVELIDEEVSP